MKGWWNMACWNGLSSAQQEFLIKEGYLPLGYIPDGKCQRGAQVCVETEDDVAPGPRFYCRPCAVEYLQGRIDNEFGDWINDHPDIAQALRNRIQRGWKPGL